MEPKISLKDVKQKSQELFMGQTDLNKSVLDILRWLGENDSRLDADAKAYSDRVFDNLSKEGERHAREMPEGIEKRKALRLAMSAQGKHYSSKSFLDALESPPINADALLEEWSALFLKDTQTILDFLFDVTQAGTQGNYRIATISLLYNVVDELTSAHLLSRHGYFPQANGHLRTVLEIVDRIELFVKETKWVELWASGDDKKIWNELRPASVRKKLGREKDDPMYGFLSEHGTHPTFSLFKGRAVLLNNGAEVKTAKIFVAGVPLEHVRMFNFVIGLMVVTLAIGRVVGCFPDLLNEEEVMMVLRENIEAHKAFQQKHFLPWIKKQGMDGDELANFLANFSMD